MSNFYTNGQRAVPRPGWLEVAPPEAPCASPGLTARSRSETAPRPLGRWVVSSLSEAW